MTIVVNIIPVIVGSIQVFTESEVSNWDDVIGLVTEDNCTFEIKYSGTVYTGTISKSTDHLALLVGFDQQDVVIGSSQCMIVNCVQPIQPPNDPCPNNSQILNNDTKLAVLDSDGCQIGFVTFQQIRDAIMNDLPTGLCDLMGVTEIPQGNLVAQDRILTTSGACTLKSVPQSQVVCI